MADTALEDKDVPMEDVTEVDEDELLGTKKNGEGEDENMKEGEGKDESGDKKEKEEEEEKKEEEEDLDDGGAASDLEFAIDDERTNIVGRLCFNSNVFCCCFPPPPKNVIRMFMC
jgi:hypothetical protein